MGISYKKLWVMLIQKDITKSQLRTDIGLSAGTISKLNEGEAVALSVSCFGFAIYSWNVTLEIFVRLCGEKAIEFCFSCSSYADRRS